MRPAPDRATRRRLALSSSGHEASEHVANLLLCDVLEQLSEKAMLLPFGRRPLVEAFGVRYALGGVVCFTLEHGDLWPVRHTDRVGGRLVVDGRGAPVLRIRAGRLQDARGRDLGSALEHVAYVVQGATVPADGPLPRPRRPTVPKVLGPGRRSTPVGTSKTAAPARAVST